MGTLVTRHRTKSGQSRDSGNIGPKELNNKQKQKTQHRNGQHGTIEEMGCAGEACTVPMPYKTIASIVKYGQSIVGYRRKPRLSGLG